MDSEFDKLVQYTRHSLRFRGAKANSADDGRSFKLPNGALNYPALTSVSASRRGRPAKSANSGANNGT